MKYSLLLVALLSASSLMAVDTVQAQDSQERAAVQNGNVQSETDKCQSTSTDNNSVLSKHKSILISVTGQGVAPMSTTSPAQAYALAKRAAVADAYRMIAEKVKGVRVDGEDLIKNMMVKRSTVRTSVQAMVKNANVVETTFKDGLCEVEMEITLSYSQFAR